LGQTGGPRAQGLYDPAFEHDSCGFGFVVDIAGRPSHDIVRDALTVLVNLEHRGATGSEKNTGDGAGLTIQIPHRFLYEVADKSGLKLRGRGGYGVGMVFLPPDKVSRVECFRLFERVVEEEGLHFLGWREVPTDNTGLGASAKASQPLIRQVFIDRPEGMVEDLAFERKLYVVRRLVEKAVSRSAIPSRGDFYIPSLSCRTIVYKGMLNASQLRTFYPDLLDERVESAIAMVHSRFSTNTFPSGPGPIRTATSPTTARSTPCAATSTGCTPASRSSAPSCSATSSDQGPAGHRHRRIGLGRCSTTSSSCSTSRAAPGPRPDDDGAGALAAPRVDAPEKKAFYEYHACLMEPWDGPASIAFTDGIRIGATLDRNGLRPARYYVTKDGRVVMASEAGVLDIPADQIVAKGRLQPGRMFLVDTAEQRIVSDDELKHRVATEHPYAGVAPRVARQADRAAPAAARHRAGPRDRAAPPGSLRLHRRGRPHDLINPMAADGTEPVGAMGNDVALAVLSEHPQLLYDYFKQLFAQVTNPPIDSIRERSSPPPRWPSARGQPPGAGRKAAHQLELPSPVLSNEELEKIRTSRRRRSTASRRSPCRSSSRRRRRRRRAPQGHRAAPRPRSEAIAEGHNIIILSDRGHDADEAPIPALLAVSAVHHHLVRAGTRTKAGPRPRVGRAARGPSLRPAHRLRRQRRQPLPRLRDRPRPGPPGHDHRRSPSWPRRSTARPSPRASSRSSPRWASAPSRATTAPRSSRPSGSTRTSSTSTSPGRRPASAASASTSSPAK
jgi:glutamate synthase (NADPH/NADH) large chain